MNFHELHELVRQELLQRIESGSLTRSRLAQQADFQQAHISNFLNRRRSLSLEGLDRVLLSQSITIDQLLPLSLSAAAAAPTVSMPGDSIEAVPIVSASVAMDDARISPSAVIETLPVSASTLYGNRSRASSKSANWQRFIAIRADVQQASAMEPLLTPGAVVVIDRHYTSLAPYRAHQRSLYAVRCGPTLLLRYVDLDEGHLVLRPFSLASPVQLLRLATHQTPADYLVGRACLIASEP